MVFNSLVFIPFMALVLAVRYAPIGWRSKKWFLTAASYAFYAAWNPPFVLLLLGSTVVDWVLARRMPAATSRGRRGLLWLSVCTNLGLLSVFKYGDFICDMFAQLLGVVGVAYEAPELGLILPVGISFYTFQTLSWSIDAYRGRLDAREVSFGDFALYVAFFPQLVAGPIVRAVEFLPQLTTPRPYDRRTFSWGATLLVIGLFEKMAIADGVLSRTSDRAFAAATELSTLDAWFGALAFGGQIYFDFAGYSTCAIGVAMMLGFALPDNFRFPYAAIGFSDFWRRWHISLSTWLRDYLYIPLGGNRQGERRRSVNLMITMLLGGLWHGAGLAFVLWGALHGAFLGIERATLHVAPEWMRGRVGSGLALLATQVGVLVAWVPFRATNLPDALHFLAAMGGAGSADRVLSSGNIALTTLVCGSIYAGQYWLRSTTLESLAGSTPGWVWGGFLGLMMLGVLTSGGESRAFIYFQF